MTDRAERKLSAILAADIEGYNRLVEHDEEATVRALRDHLDAILPIIADYGGRVIDTAGDGVLTEFASAVRATEAAIAIQRQTQKLDADVPLAKQLRFRIGINVGDVIVEDGKLLGDGVNVAARLEQLAEPGGILLSGTAYDQLRGKLDLPLDFAGDQAVKNISQPVRTYSVRMDGAKRTLWLRARGTRRYLPLALGLLVLAIAGGAAWWLQPKEVGLTAKPSIAVLPFASIGGDERTGYFADGITDDIITDLAGFREMDVIASNSTAVYKGKPVDVRQVGRDLNVRYVLEGSVQREACSTSRHGSFRSAPAVPAHAHRSRRALLCASFHQDRHRKVQGLGDALEQYRIWCGAPFEPGDCVHAGARTGGQLLLRQASIGPRRCDWRLTSRDPLSDGSQGEMVLVELLEHRTGSCEARWPLPTRAFGFCS
jgi:class 3 adenylate cyclase